MSKLVALEVMPTVIRAAEISGYNTKKAKLIRTGEVTLERDVAGESSVIDRNEFITALKKLWSESKFSTKQVGLVISGRRFLVRPHVTSSPSMAVLRNMLLVEASESLPGQTDDLLYDFYPTHKLDTKFGERTSGLVISHPSESIVELAFAIQGAKLQLEFVDFAPVAITRWIQANRKERNYALVNIRDYSTDVAVVENGMPRMIRVLSKGLDPKRRIIGASLDSEPENRSPFAGGEIQAVDNSIKLLVQDINLTIRNQQETDAKIECVFTSGPRAEDAELRALLEDRFDVPVIPLQIEADFEGKTMSGDRKPSIDEFVAMCGGMR